MPDNIVLTGFSGTGKSTVAGRLASALGWPVIDTDQLVVRRFGKTIAHVFRDDGEAVFRAAERAALVEACAERHRVVSIGGGAVVDPRNRDTITNGNTVIRLDAPPEVILSRLRGSPDAEERPMLDGSDPLGRIRVLLASREDAYSIAHHRVDTNGRSPEDIVDDILSWLGGQGVISTPITTQSGGST